jgi:hypothetical protein
MGSACEPPEGTVPNGDDCDDTDITENPGAIEICDGDDDDCDGEVDESSAEDALTFYADVDGDGYGDPGYSVTACSQPSGFVDNTLDCDDLERRTNPGAIETCDGYDNDCDYYTDEGDAADASTWYADSDSDGFGDRDRSQEACDAPDGYVGSDDDCDDADSARNPRATETCNDLDDDCDGSVDEDASDPTTWYLDADGDGYGTSSVSVAVCDRPGSYVEDDQDCNDLDVSVYPGAYDAPYDGVDSGCDGGSDYDADGDGYDSDAFGGTDCDDTDETIHEDCGYTSMTGSWAVPSVSCAWNLASAEPGGEANCPGCEFSFVTVSELAEGDCLTPVDAAFGYDQDVPELSFAFEYYAGYYLQLGPFYAALTPGVYYDRLDWSGYSYVGYYYYGSFYLY